MNERRKMTREEYEIQFFGFSHTMLYDYVKHVIIEEIKDTVTLLIENQKKKFKDTPEEDFSDVTDRLNDLYINASKKTFQNIQESIEQSIAIPDHVLLQEDEDYQRNQQVGIDMRDLDMDIEKLKQGVVKAKYMESILKEELAGSMIVLELGTRKVHELQKRSIAIKQKDRRSKDFMEKLVEKS